MFFLKHVRSTFLSKQFSLHGVLHPDPKVYQFFTTSTPSNLKKIDITKKAEVTTIEGRYIEGSGKNVLNNSCEKYCPTCPNKLGFEIDYTDVLIISQFVRADGCMLPRRVTGLCSIQNKKMKVLIHKAQRAGLMPELRPPLRSGKERDSLQSNYKWKKYNAYFNPGKLPYDI